MQTIDSFILLFVRNNLYSNFRLKALGKIMTSNTDNNDVTQNISKQINQDNKQAIENLNWLKQEMHPLFFSFNIGDVSALSLLSTSLHHLAQHKRVMLLDTSNRTIIAQIDTYGSLYKTLQDLPEQEISYAELTTSRSELPKTKNKLEVLRFDYNRKQDHEIKNELKTCELPAPLLADIAKVLQKNHPNYPLEEAQRHLEMLWCNNAEYIQVSPPNRIARVINLYAQTELNDGIHLDIQEIRDPQNTLECRLLLGMANPPKKSFLLQLLEVFNRLEISVNRSYSLNLSNSVHPYFLSTFYVVLRDGSYLKKDTDIYKNLQREIYNTQILSIRSASYKKLVTSGITTGADASLASAIISFCHTNLAHNHPGSYSLEGIMRSFHNHPDITTLLIDLFYSRFDPEFKDRKSKQLAYKNKLDSVKHAVENFNSGRKFLDNFRRTIFQCALTFIQFTIKTNFFVAEKHALAFRLDPAYLEELNDEFTQDLPTDRPFRVTFFSGRNGIAYHIGFSDIARGGWRTIITEGRDNYITSANTMFKENYVLAHTQHLKNKDIYEGGSKMVAVLRLSSSKDKESINQQLYKLQFSFINAFFDLFVTENGKAKDPRIIDYYAEEEAIELGPDENMHDVMVETIAKQGVKRGYILGAGIISSKKVGINHKDYGVTSLGVIRFAEVTMQSVGINMHQDDFSVKFTGGPNGDVAGNCMRLLQERCSNVRIKLIIDGSGALFDPNGLDNTALSKVILKDDLDAFAPSALHEGGFLLYRNQTQVDGISTLYKKITKTQAGLQEAWISTDKFYKEFNSLLFTVNTDLFIPAGGRPETIDITNANLYFDNKGKASANVIVEGANSFITPDARVALQQKGVVIIRDASANKCGVTSSSYEIIANLIFSDEEFLENKESYVSNVIDILNQMAEREANLIIKRHNESNGTLLYTEISDHISREINAHYDRIFAYLQANPELLAKENYQHALLLHLPDLIRTTEGFRNRVRNLPEKIKYAILASKLSSSMVYEGDNNSLYGGMIEAQIASIIR